MNNPEQNLPFDAVQVERNICPECGHVRGEGLNCRICKREQVKQKVHEKFDDPKKKEVTSNTATPFTERPEIKALNERIEESKKRGDDHLDREQKTA